jgi:hypothetical protein
VSAFSTDSVATAPAPVSERVTTRAFKADSTAPVATFAAVSRSFRGSTVTSSRPQTAISTARSVDAENGATHNTTRSVDSTDIAVASAGARGVTERKDSAYAIAPTCLCGESNPSEEHLTAEKLAKYETQLQQFIKRITHTQRRLSVLSAGGSFSDFPMNTGPSVVCKEANIALEGVLAAQAEAFQSLSSVVVQQEPVVYSIDESQSGPAVDYALEKANASLAKGIANARAARKLGFLAWALPQRRNKVAKIEPAPQKQTPVESGSLVRPPAQRERTNTFPSMGSEATAGSAIPESQPSQRRAHFTASELSSDSEVNAGQRRGGYHTLGHIDEVESKSDAAVLEQYARNHGGQYTKLPDASTQDEQTKSGASREPERSSLKEAQYAERRQKAKAARAKYQFQDDDYDELDQLEIEASLATLGTAKSSLGTLAKTSGSETDKQNKQIDLITAKVSALSVVIL